MWQGAWAQYRAVSINELAVLPQGVEMGAASTLPVAGVTVLRALRTAGDVTGKRVLVTGAAGGVGRFAIQLARLAGAEVIAVVSCPERALGLQELGVTQIVTAPTEVAGQVDVVLEAGGADLLAAATQILCPQGLIVSISGSLSPGLALPEGRLIRFSMGGHVGQDLQFLVSLLATGQLQTSIGYRSNWREFDQAAKQLLDRNINGKAVLDID